MTIPLHLNIEATTSYEEANLRLVRSHMEEIAKIPVLRAMAVMPDACPSGSLLGTIPVGAVTVAEEAIIPDHHSADVCCSMAASTFDPDTNPKQILDAAMQICHFGQGGREPHHDFVLSSDLKEAFEQNPYLTNKKNIPQKHLGTIGASNHFLFVGRLDSTGQIVLVTHHGSRKPGAMLYEVGTKLAQKMTGKDNPTLGRHNLWIPYNSPEGRDYWDALQTVRLWTKENHFSTHNALMRHLGLKLRDRFWNEHNFVFLREHEGKNYFFHAKGATPAYSGFSPDNEGKTLIPLNMAAPILIAKTNPNPNFGMNFDTDTSLGFCPHGAGRNYSRGDFTRKMIEGGTSPKQMIQDVTSRFDIRAFSGKHDISEFPSAYKNPEQIISAIERFNLVQIIDRIQPLGSIMAGHPGKREKSPKQAREEKFEEGF